jgi:hypothetical protein
MAVCSQSNIDKNKNTKFTGLDILLYGYYKKILFKKQSFDLDVKCQGPR